MACRQLLDENSQPPINPYPGTREILNNAVTLNGKRHCLPVTKEYELTEFKDVFEGVGKLPGGKPDAQPVQKSPKAVPEKRK